VSYSLFVCLCFFFVLFVCLFVLFGFNVWFVLVLLCFVLCFLCLCYFVVFLFVF